MSMVSRSIEISATPTKCMKVIKDYAKYSEFLKDLKNVEVHDKKGKVKDVTFTIEVIKKISYTLKMNEESKNKLSWTFVEGDIMKDNSGFWELEEIKKGLTKATYNIEVKFGLLVPKAVTKTLVGKNLPELLENFKNRIEELA